MPVPKKKTSKSRRNMRRANHDKVKHVPHYTTCANPACKEPMMPHRVCPHCGWYAGREVIKVGKGAETPAETPAEKK